MLNNPSRSRSLLGKYLAIGFHIDAATSYNPQQSQLVGDYERFEYDETWG